MIIMSHHNWPQSSTFPLLYWSSVSYGCWPRCKNVASCFESVCDKIHVWLMLTSLWSFLNSKWRMENPLSLEFLNSENDFCQYTAYIQCNNTVKVHCSCPVKHSPSPYSTFVVWSSTIKPTSKSTMKLTKRLFQLPLKLATYNKNNDFW